MAAKDYPEFGDFPSTRWSLIFSAHDQDSARRREALEELLQLYLPALRAHLLYRRKIERDRAEELLQGFVADQIFQRDMLARADPARGRFRSFLLKSLENYVGKQRQREVRRREVALEREPAGGATADVFEVQWARQLLQESLRRMRENCASKGQPSLWELFDCRVVGPTLSGSPLPSYRSLVERFGFRSAEQTSNALVTAKRQFERTLAAVIAETECVTSDKEIEAEIADLCEILERAGPLAVEYDRGLLAGPQPSGRENMPALDNSSSKELACLLSVRGMAEGNWQPAELGDLLRHCLTVPASEYIESPGQPAEFAADSSAECATADMALDELFQSAQPPLGLLIAVKRSARRLMDSGASDLPAAVHRLIYFAAIATAMARHGQRISRSSPDVLRVTWKCLAAESHVDDGLKRLFGTALERLSGQEPATQ
jgi:RNA polymerase sigma-70 factor (ECF subfamily)